MSAPRRRKPKTSTAAKDGSASPARNFTISTEEKIRALTIGPPAWSVRKKRIEDALEAFVDQLLDLRDELLASGMSEAEAHPRLLARARAFNVAPVQQLIDKHNRYYPMEANLPMDARGRFLAQGELWEPEPDLDATRLIALLDAALEPVSLAPRSRRSGPASRAPVSRGPDSRAPRSGRPRSRRS
ncbi:MAG: hypothetical protein R3B36_28050 [Polyangiaceae bacterium]